MRFRTINQTFKSIYIILLLVGIILFTIITYNFSNDIIESNNKNLAFKHSVNAKQQTDQLLGYILINNENAVNYYLESIKKEEGLNKVYISKSNPCLKNTSCMNETLQVVSPIAEIKSFLVKEVQPHELVYSEILQYISTSAFLFFFFVIFSWLLMTKFIKVKFINIISDFKNLLSGKKLPVRSSLVEVRELLEENKRMIKQAEKVKIAQQVAHDIQSPLEILKTLEHDLNKEKNIDKSILSEAINRIIAISNDLLSNRQNKVEYFSPNDPIEEIIAEKKNINKNISIRYKNKTKDDFQIYFNKTHLKRILSNIINNSIEAQASEINILSNIQEGHFQLLISDNGNGIIEDDLESIFKEGYTTKKLGHGIGLSFAKVVIEEFNGSIKALNSKNFTIKITFPISTILKQKDSNQTVVLIDDDKLTHLSWERNAHEKGIKLLSFYTVSDFISKSSYIDYRTPIYIDSNLSKYEKGEVLSKHIFDLGFKNIYLETGSSPECFDLPYWIKGIQGKSFYAQ